MPTPDVYIVGFALGFLVGVLIDLKSIYRFVWGTAVLERKFGESKLQYRLRMLPRIHWPLVISIPFVTGAALSILFGGLVGLVEVVS